jgi:uncharacterized protein (DUF433 family)
MEAQSKHCVQADSPARPLTMLAVSGVGAYSALMSELNMTQTIPLVRGKDGVLRVTGSRVTLDSIAHQFKSGATAEQIQEDFPSLALRDIYAVIAYYLQHANEVEDYLSEQAQEANVARRKRIEAGSDTGGLRERLRQRRAQTTA